MLLGMLCGWACRLYALCFNERIDAAFSLYHTDAAFLLLQLLYSYSRLLVIPWPGTIAGNWPPWLRMPDFSVFVQSINGECP